MNSVSLFAGNKTAGMYKEFLKASAIESCAIQCCIQKAECNVAFVFNEKCFHVKCNSNEQCLPLERTNMELKLKMVLVNPVTPGKSKQSMHSSFQNHFATN